MVLPTYYICQHSHYVIIRCPSLSFPSSLYSTGPQPHIFPGLSLVPYRYDPAKLPECALANRQFWIICALLTFNLTKLVTFQTIVQPLRLPSRCLLPYQYHQAVQLLNKDSKSESGSWYATKEVESESWKENGLELENFSSSRQKSVRILKTCKDQMMSWTRKASIKVAKWGIPMQCLQHF